MREPEQAEEGPEPLLPDGNPVRLRSLPLALVAALGAILVMAADLSPRLGVPLGLGACLLVTLAVLDVMGSFGDDGMAAASLPLRHLLVPAGGTMVALGALVLALRAAVQGWLPSWVAAVLISVGFLAVVWLGHRFLDRLGVAPSAPPLAERWGFWVVVIATLLYLPTLGRHALTDPWETHYGEVAREILARRDWISLWWAQDGWFWSKPVLSFWAQALAMALLGVRYEPGQMLSAVAEGLEPHPEWALRFPTFLLTLVGVGLLYRGVATGYGRRAAFFAAVMLLAAPQFALLAHQSMTDMPFVACMAGAMGLVMAAVNTAPDERVPVYEVTVGRFGLRLSLFHVVVGALLMLVIPQALYLVSRNVAVALTPHYDLRIVGDSFAAGSVGNCDLPGNAPCQSGLMPVITRFPPGVQALLWGQCAALVLWLSWGERRRQRLLMLGAWTLVALSTMAKGPAGLGLPLLATFGFVVATGRWRDLARMEIPAGLLIFASVTLPWVVAMYVRHGPAFTDRLLFHDMFKRAFRHVHDTNEGDDVSFRYYVWQLGYATFPWIGLAPVALVRWLRRRVDEPEPARRSVDLLAAGWFVTGFVLFSLMGTKFHHYALPLVPPMAVLSGRLLDELWRGAEDDQSALLGAAALGAAFLTFLVGRDLAFSVPGRFSHERLFHLITYNYERPWPAGLSFSTPLWLITVAASLCLLAMVAARRRRPAIGAFLAVTMASATWLIADYLEAVTPHYAQKNLLVRYERARADEPGPLIAYQMNWKGENFYRGNRLAAFVSTGVQFQDWIDDQKRAGRKVMYFLSEPKRVASLHGELGRPRDFERLTTPALNNKFVLLRVRFP